MYEDTIIQLRGFHNNIDYAGNIEGFQFDVRTKYYSGNFLSSMVIKEVTVDGIVFPRESQIWVIDGVPYRPDDMLELGDVYWQLDQCATIKIKLDGGLAQGYHDVSINFGWIHNYAPLEEQPHTPAGNSRRMLIV